MNEQKKPKKYPKMSLAKQKVTVVDGYIFASRKEAAIYAGCSLVTLLKRIRDYRCNYG